MEVLRTYLEMTDPAQLRRAAHRAEARIEKVARCPASFYRYLYGEVGRDYNWIDRLDWTDEQIRSHLDQPDISLWVIYVEGSPAGYFELRRHEDGSTEIAYFGLLPEFIGRGLGGYLLTRAVECAWETGANRVWLHTCSLDHPAALPNYLKRGFAPFKEEVYWVELPTTLTKGPREI